MTNGRYAYKAVQHGDDTAKVHVYKFTTKANYDMYRYMLARSPPDEVVSHSKHILSK